MVGNDGTGQTKWDGGCSGMPAPAFREAADGVRGWGIRPGDVAVIIATVLAALAVCCVLWFAYGVQGVPGISTGDGQGAEESAAGSDAPAAGEGEGTAAGVATTGTTDNAQSPAATSQPSALDAGGSPAPSTTSPSTDAGSSLTAAAQSAQTEGDAVQPLYAVIQNSDSFYQVLPLAEDAQVTVESSLGTNVIEVVNGRVRCLESDCSNQTCVKQGWVSGQGQTIVCLPHKLTVQVVADPKDASPLR